MKKIFLLLAVIALASGCQPKEKKTQSTPAETAITPVSYEIVIEGMTCTGCEETIEGSVNKLEGIVAVDADHLKGDAMIKFDGQKTDTAAIRSAITGVGYTVVAFKPVEDTNQPE